MGIEGSYVYGPIFTDTLNNVPTTGNTITKKTITTLILQTKIQIQNEFVMGHATQIKKKYIYSC